MIKDKKMTILITGEMREEMQKYQHINWSEICRVEIRRILRGLKGEEKR